MKYTRTQAVEIVGSKVVEEVEAELRHIITSPTKIWKNIMMIFQCWFGKLNTLKLNKQ